MHEVFIPCRVSQDYLGESAIELEDTNTFTFHLYLLAGLFGWMNIVREEDPTLGLELERAGSTLDVRLLRRVNSIRYVFMEDQGTLFHVPRSVQRALGDMMRQCNASQPQRVMSYTGARDIQEGQPPFHCRSLSNSIPAPLAVLFHSESTLCNERRICSTP